MNNYTYNRKPESIEAFKWTGDIEQGGEPEWIVEALKNGSVKIDRDNFDEPKMILSGIFVDYTASIGDYICRLGDGEPYVMSAEDFESRYSIASAAISSDFSPINTNWTDADGNHQGGQSTGIGYTIAWQRGGLNVAGRNGAFLLEVLGSCLSQLQYFQDSKFASYENQHAIACLKRAIYHLESRKNRRQQEGTLGTHELDTTEFQRPQNCTTVADLYAILGQLHPQALVYIWADKTCHELRVVPETIGDIDDNEDHQLSKHSPEYADILVSGVDSYVLLEKTESPIRLVGIHGA